MNFGHFWASPLTFDLAQCQEGELQGNEEHNKENNT